MFLHRIIFAAALFLAVANVSGNERNAVKVDVSGYFTILNSEVTDLLSNNPVFDADPFKSFTGDIQGAPFNLALSKATVVDIKNITHERTEDLENSTQAFGTYFSLGESALCFKFVLTQVSTRSVYEGNVTLVFSKMKERLVLALHEKINGAYGTEILEEHLFFPGTVKTVEISPSTSPGSLKEFVLSFYNDDVVDFAMEVTDAFELHLNKAIKKVDINKYITKK